MIDVKGRKYTVLGAGRSGIGIAKLLKMNQAEVFLSDSSPREKLLYLNENVLVENKIDYELGKNSDKVFDCEVMVVSPGIPSSADIIIKAKKHNIKVVSEIEVSFNFCNAPIIAITGTNGKTTTTELTGAILREAGFDVHVCGNVGIAFSEIIPKLRTDSVVVLETSSFQLENIFEFRPKVSMILNITPDHIDWHGGFENYFATKLKINNNQKDDDIIIINYDDNLLRQKISALKSTIGSFSEHEFADAGVKNKCYLKNGAVYYAEYTEERIIERKDIYLKGMHNVMNAMASIIAAKKFKVDSYIIANVLKVFKGVEHRIEFTREIEGVDYYNDSKATNYNSLYVALESFSKNIILIMGGKKGDNNFGLVDELVKERVKFICAIGQSKEVIFEQYKNTKDIQKFDTLDEAIKYARLISKPGDHVLFSPGYKSFDMFNNFEHRGDVFKQIVNSL